MHTMRNRTAFEISCRWFRKPTWPISLRFGRKAVIYRAQLLWSHFQNRHATDYGHAVLKSCTSKPPPPVPPAPQRQTPVCSARFPPRGPWLCGGCRLSFTVGRPLALTALQTRLNGSRALSGTRPRKSLVSSVPQPKADARAAGELRVKLGDFLFAQTVGEDHQFLQRVLAAAFPPVDGESRRPRPGRLNRCGCLSSPPASRGRFSRKALRCRRCRAG